MIQLRIQALGVLLSVLLLSAPAVQGQESQEVRDFVFGMTLMADAEGFDIIDNTQLGWLNDNETGKFEVYLSPGDYTVTAACDEDCMDLDLVVTGMTEVGRDREMNDYPLVIFSVESAGSFSVDVEMATCTRNPCEWGAIVFGLPFTP